MTTPDHSADHVAEDYRYAGQITTSEDPYRKAAGDYRPSRFWGRDIKPFRGLTRRWFVRLEFKPQDLWVGAYWDREMPWRFDLWVCLVPMVPIHVGWRPQAKGVGFDAE